MRAAYGVCKKKPLPLKKSGLKIKECAIKLIEWLARSHGAGLICMAMSVIRVIN